MVPGTVSGFILLLLFIAAVLWRIQCARVSLPELRHIAAADAINEVIGRCIEMGRPLHVSPGLGALTGSTAPATLAGLQCIEHVAHQAARFDAELITTVGVTEVYTVADAMVMQAYREEGKGDAYHAGTVRYLPGDSQFAYAAAVMDMYEREKVAGNILIGNFAALALLLVEAGHNAGALQIGGTTASTQVPFFVAACDYFLIGEEILTIGAYLSRDPVRMGSVVGQDICKIVFIAIIILGAGLRALGSNVMVNLLSK